MQHEQQSHNSKYLMVKMQHHLLRFNLNLNAGNYCSFFIWVLFLFPSWYEIDNRYQV